jgi:uncharacterized protein (DUF2147 family)
MKLTLAALAAVFIAGTAAADPLEGRWQTAPDDNGNFGFIDVAPCGPALCGTLVVAFDSTGTQVESPNVGRLIIWDTVASGEGAYEGRIYAPDRDKEYASSLTLAGDQLSVSGCVFGICRQGGTWVRVQ